MFVLVVFVGVFLLPVTAQFQIDDKNIESLIPSANDALALAELDLRSLDRETRLYTRYIWITNGEFEDLQCSSLVLNYISRGTVALRPMPLGKGKLMLARLDLRHYAPRPTDLLEFTKVWEELRYDPKFNLLFTKDTLKFSGGISFPKSQKMVKHKRAFESDPYKGKDGKIYYWDEKTKDYYLNKWVEEDRTEYQEFGKNVEVARVIAKHIDPMLISSIIDSTQSVAPVVSHQYFIFRAMSTLQDKGVYKEVYGGLYYQFAGIKRGFKKGTDEDHLLEKLGVGNVEAGITASKLFDSLRSDQRVAVFRSGITGKPRRVDLLRTLATRENQGLILITHDLKAQDIDIGTHPIMNLLDFKDAAREVIWETLLGLHGFALFNGNGELQDVVPADVAIDHTVPIPNRAELQPAIGCIRCHAKESGWRILTNDVKKLTKGVDILNDTSQKNKDPADLIDRLAGLYSGDLENKLLPRARDDYNSAILKATGPWKKSKDQTDLARLSGQKMGDIYADYWYAQVDAKKALLDLGHNVKDSKEAAVLLTKLLPPVPLVTGDGYIPEDPRIVALKVGLEINRSDYDLVYSFVADRIAITKGVKK